MFPKFTQVRLQAIPQPSSENGKRIKLNSQSWLQHIKSCSWATCVATFTGKNHFKLIHNDMKGVSARAYNTNYFQRLTLESWFTSLQQTPLNRCQQVWAPYKWLIHAITKAGILTDHQGGVLTEKLGGVCSPLSKYIVYLTLFMTKIFDIPYPTYCIIWPKIWNHFYMTWPLIVRDWLNEYWQTLQASCSQYH